MPDRIQDQAHNRFSINSCLLHYHYLPALAYLAHLKREIDEAWLTFAKLGLAYYQHQRLERAS